MRTIAELRASVPQRGRVERILLRPGRREHPTDVDGTRAVVGSGLEGDRQRPGRSRTSDRQVTLVQAEHLPVVGSLLGEGPPRAVDAALLRRNLVVSGLPLLALKGMRFRVGDAELVGTGPCHPCSRMEEALGAGGYQAMRGHGGITARVAVAGDVEVGSAVTVLGPDEDA